MVTGCSEPKTVLSAFRELADAYVVKPFGRDEIQAAITKAGLEITL